MLTVLCPSRGRPDKAEECYRSFLDTRHETESSMVFVLDEDDGSAPDYDVPIQLVERGRPGMTDALNAALKTVWDQAEVIGFVGDDHRFRTSGWDKIFIDQLRAVEGGLVFANDLARHDIPTQIFGSAKIWKALGWMALPEAQHLYLDNTWRVIGDELDRLYYFPDVVIEHMHPSLQKGDWDEGYATVNASAMYDHDQKAFGTWLESHAQEDIARVRAAL